MENEPIEINFTPRFQRDIRELAKRYRSLKTDIQSLIEQLQAGQTPGDRITGSQYAIFKVRVRNSNLQRGKSGGYRVIYYVKTPTSVILATIYAKSDTADVSNAVIEAAIEQYERGLH